MTKTDKGPIACDLTRIPPDLRRALEADLRRLLAEVEEVRALDDGYALRFAAPEGPGLISRLGALVDHDRLCCPFIAHAIRGEPWGGPVWLHLTGSLEARAYVATALARLLPPPIAARAGLSAPAAAT